MEVSLPYFLLITILKWQVGLEVNGMEEGATILLTHFEVLGDCQPSLHFAGRNYNSKLWIVDTHAYIICKLVLFFISPEQHNYLHACNSEINEIEILFRREFKCFTV